MNDSTVFLRAAILIHEEKILGTCLAIDLAAKDDAGSGTSNRCSALFELLYRDDSPTPEDPYWLGYPFDPACRELRIYALLLAAEWAKDEE